MTTLSNSPSDWATRMPPISEISDEQFRDLDEKNSRPNDVLSGLLDVSSYHDTQLKTLPNRQPPNSKQTLFQRAIPLTQHSV